MRKRQAVNRMLSDKSVPDTLLPEQYFDRLAARASDSPEKRLMFAVLLDAFISLQRANSIGANEAELWIQSDDATTPFSFKGICEALGIEASFLARGLLTWRSTLGSSRFGMPVRQLFSSRPSK